MGGLDTDTFVEPELVRYPSTEGVKVPAFLYKPKGRSTGATMLVPEAAARLVVLEARDDSASARRRSGWR